MDGSIRERPVDFTGLSRSAKPGNAEAEQAIRTLIQWIGDDPKREGLVDTPARVLRACREWFAGYTDDPAAHLARTFEEVSGYDEPVLLRDIPFHSCCEHHLAPITGVAHICYLPAGRVAGISKLARVVDGVAKRLQIQERMTAEIAGVIDEGLRPRGVGVVIRASHACMSSRGVHMHGISMVTSRMLGVFKEDAVMRAQFLASVRQPATNAVQET